MWQVKKEGVNFYPDYRWDGARCLHSVDNSFPTPIE